MRHPTSGEQLTFERREYRADPIEGPEESFSDRVLLVIAAVGLVALAIVVLHLG